MTVPREARDNVTNALQRRRGRLAEALARRRVPAGFVCAAVALWLARPTFRSVTIGALVAVAGEILRIWSAGHLEKGREVTSSGPYRFTRHPLYVGSSVIGAGIAIASASIGVALLTTAYLAVTLTAAIRTEERHLTQKFGEAYPQYRSGEARTAGRGFSFARVMRNREYRAVAGLIAALALLAWKAH